MYLVRQQGETIQVFTKFVDAWLYVYLECDCYAVIVERERGDTLDTWTINPAYQPSHPIN